MRGNSLNCCERVCFGPCITHCRKPRWMEAAMKPVVCLKCGCSDIRRSKRHGLLEWILKRFFIVPWRCMSCDNRFFRPRFGKISFTRQRFRSFGGLWVTFRSVLRSFSPFMILCFAIAHGSPAYNQPDVLKLWAAPKTESRPVFGKMRQCGAEPIVQQ